MDFLPLDGWNLILATKYLTIRIQFQQIQRVERILRVIWAWRRAGKYFCCWGLLCRIRSVCSRTQSRWRPRTRIGSRRFENLRCKEGSQLLKPKLHPCSIVMDSTVAHAAKPVSDGSHAPEAASHANLQSEDAAPPPQAALLNSEDLRTLHQPNPHSHPADLPKEALHAPASAEVAPTESNPYIARSTAANSSASKSISFSRPC